jgi:hypothetical protein
MSLPWESGHPVPPHFEHPDLDRPSTHDDACIRFFGDNLGRGMGLKGGGSPVPASSGMSSLVIDPDQTELNW